MRSSISFPYQCADVNTLEALRRLGFEHMSWQVLPPGKAPGDEVSFAVSRVQRDFCILPVVEWLLRAGRPVDWASVRAEMERQRQSLQMPPPFRVLEGWVAKHAGGL